MSCRNIFDTTQSWSQKVYNLFIDIFWKEEYSLKSKLFESQNVRKSNKFAKNKKMIKERPEVLVGILAEGEKKMLERMKPIIVEQLNVEEAAVTAEANFKEDLGADSLDLFELVMALEEEFGVEIPSEDLESIATVADVIEYLKNKGVTA